MLQRPFVSSEAISFNGPHRSRAEATADIFPAVIHLAYVIEAHPCCSILQPMANFKNSSPARQVALYKYITFSLQIDLKSNAQKDQDT